MGVFFRQQGAAEGHKEKENIKTEMQPLQYNGSFKIKIQFHNVKTLQ